MIDRCCQLEFRTTAVSFRLLTQNYLLSTCSLAFLTSVMQFC